MERVYFHCLSAECLTPSSPPPAPKWTEGRKEEVWRKGTRVLGVSACPTLCCWPFAPLSHFLTAISCYTGPASLYPDPHSQPLCFPCSSSPVQCSAGSNEGPHTDLKEPGTTIRAHRQLPVRPQGKSATVTRTGAHYCAREVRWSPRQPISPRPLAGRGLPTHHLCPAVPTHFSGPFRAPPFIK